ncbi:MAG: DUF4870 domain-containing protein [Micrococcales bacterium]|nr:DUF4870 domain-containing protein [Micrococcales bacterium]
MMTQNTSAITSDERTRGMIVHLVAAVFTILGALVVWLLHKDKPGFAREQATGALNFQIGIFAVEVVAWILGFIIWPLGLLVGLAWLVGVVFAVLGAVTVNKGESYRYPFGLRIVT